MEIRLLAMPMMMSQILKSVDFTKHKNLDIWRTKYFFLQINEIDISKRY